MTGSSRTIAGWTAEVCLDHALVCVGEKQMAQHNDPNGFAVALAPVVSPDRTPDPVAIFSAPDVVFHWWAESKRRWAEQNRSNALIAHPMARVADTAPDDGQ
jgi:hypothetical protein